MAITNFYGSLLMALQSRIEEKLPEVNYIQQEMGQLDNIATSGVLFPCVLIDLPGGTFTQESALAENGDITIQLKLVVDVNGVADANAARMTEATLACYELENRLYTAIKGWQPEDGICQPLNRVSDAGEVRGDGLKVRKLTFSTSFEDSSAAIVYLKQSPALELV
ncbi:hypothetical protein SAMN05421788_101825 [Filimonas lacunae]|uniref:Uncharacterized protein n=1 Tax=Filimonas lacunae TaxID=477680 RepID=A0A173MPX0_9BACT|nr:hypothetical protein [Filimonas lacunae]BAV09388.1 hypothetical protein FLA_5436 [Filimonas lacunae]SIS72258.1 hypothetical protein SAMN05421788_101825 [Filimonas lacunae]